AVPVGWAELGEAAVPSVRRGPSRITAVDRSAVILAAADGDVGICGVEVDSHELNSVEVAVKVAPLDGRSAVQAEEAAVITVQQLAVGVEGDGVVVGVGGDGAVGKVEAGPAHSAVGAANNGGRLAERRAGRAPGVDDGRVRRIDDQGRVVVALEVQV